MSLSFYPVLKLVHITCVVLSVCGFVVRWGAMLAEAGWVKRRWVRIAPHVVDTFLLGSAIALAVALRQYPFVHFWLTAKVLGLLAYIGLGMVALRRGRTIRIRLAAFVAALATFGYIVSVALTKDVLGFLNWM